MQNLSLVFNGRELLFQNNVNPHIETKNVLLLDKMSQEQLLNFIQNNIIDSVFYYMQENNLLED